MAASNVVSSVAVGVFESVNLALRAPYVLILNSAPNYGLYYRPLKSFVHVGATLAALPAVIASSAVAATLSHTMGVLGAAICLGPIGWFGACGY